MVLETNEKEELIEEVGMHFQERTNFTPLSARIYALMILSSDKGHSFEEIMAVTGASKSSISTNLNLLVQLKYVGFYTKSGDRKRYFRPTQDYLRLTLTDHLENLEKELSLVEKINDFNSAHNPQKFRKNESIGLIFQKYLKSQKENISNAIAKMVAFQNT